MLDVLLGILQGNILQGWGGSDSIQVKKNSNANDDELWNDDEEWNNSIKLIHAAEKGYIANVKKLIEEGVDVDAQDRQGRTALMLAAREGHLEVVEVLLAKNANVNLQNKYGGTALSGAAAKGHLEIVEALLAKNANVDLQTNGGWTALMNAAAWGHLEVVEVLLAENANVNLKNEDGETALDCARSKIALDRARRKNRPAIIQLLKNAQKGIRPKSTINVKPQSTEFQSQNESTETTEVLSVDTIEQIKQNILKKKEAYRQMSRTDESKQGSIGQTTQTPTENQVVHSFNEIMKHLNLIEQYMQKNVHQR